MTAAQARALLELMADLYRVANTTEPLEPVAPVSNGQVPADVGSATERGEYR